MDHIVLEVDAPADYIKGAYLNFLSVYNNETEILREGGTEFKVIDGGVRVKDVTDFNGDSMTIYVLLMLTLLTLAALILIYRIPGRRTGNE